MSGYTNEQDIYCQMILDTNFNESIYDCEKKEASTWFGNRKMQKEMVVVVVFFFLFFGSGSCCFLKRPIGPVFHIYDMGILGLIIN